MKPAPLHTVAFPSRGGVVHPAPALAHRSAPVSVRPRLIIGALALWGAGCAVPPTPTAPREVLVAKATCPAAGYPEEAKRSGAAGQTEVEMEVNPEGRVTRVAIAKTSGSTPGHQALDALALNTIAKCTFPPAPGFLSGSGRMVYVWKLDN